MKAIALNTWAGRRYYPVDIIGETQKKLRVQILNYGGVMLPGRRYVPAGESCLVPKNAVVDMPYGKHEDGYYDGYISGYGVVNITPDAKP
ncbi:MAG: hypothetical protein C0442_11175 [Chlorobiaceae bacterium]|nr:hypothetical protein [Chlorobiaceae bacterium]